MSELEFNHDALVDKTNTLLDEVERVGDQWHSGKDSTESLRQLRVLASGYIQSFTPTPIPRGYKFSCPHASVGDSSFIFLWDVLLGVFAVGKGSPFIHQPCVDVIAIDKAIGDEPSITVFGIPDTPDFFGVSPTS